MRKSTNAPGMFSKVDYSDQHQHAKGVHKFERRRFARSDRYETRKLLRSVDESEAEYESQVSAEAQGAYEFEMEMGQ